MNDFHSSHAVIDLDAITRNIGRLRALAPQAALMAVVKAGAYGHGIVPVARAALRAGARYIGVAQMSEALALGRSLREMGETLTDTPIFTWIAPPACDYGPAIKMDIEMSISWVHVLDSVCKAAESVGKPARVHIKIDTGMSRGGATFDELPHLISQLHRRRDEGLISIVGVWSHFSRADDLTPDGGASTADHIARFERGIAMLRDADITPPLRHISASAGILWHKEAHYDMVRAGIAMYGLSPDPSVSTSAQLGIEPAMRLEAQLMAVKHVEKGTPVSYGGTWHAPSRRWLGLVPIGYADGIFRTASNGAPVTVVTDSGPLKSTVVGRVCMDQFVIDLGEATAAEPPARVGDVAVLFGNPHKPGSTYSPSEGNREAVPDIPTADDWAQACGTINYEIISTVGARVPRVYEGGENQ